MLEVAFEDRDPLAIETKRQMRGVPDARKRNMIGSAGLLMTKLSPPPIRRGLVERDRLVDLIRLDAGAKLTVVVAPAGSGKTTFLGMWREQESTGMPVAWLTLDEGDDDPVTLWSYLVAAGRPLLGRKLKGKSEREMRDLGLVVDKPTGTEG